VQTACSGRNDPGADPPNAGTAAMTVETSDLRPAHSYVVCVDQKDLKSPRLQDLKEGDPVHSCRFHGMHNQMHLRWRCDLMFLRNPPVTILFFNTDSNCWPAARSGVRIASTTGMRDGRKRFLPARWTSLAPSDPFVITAAGRAYFRLEDLIRLADRTKEWKGMSLQGRGLCKANLRNC